MRGFTIITLGSLLATGFSLLLIGCYFGFSVVTGTIALGAFLLSLFGSCFTVFSDTVVNLIADSKKKTEAKPVPATA